MLSSTHQEPGQSSRCQPALTQGGSTKRNAWDARFDGNTAGAEGGAIHLSETRGRLSNNLIVRNVANNLIAFNSSGILGVPTLQVRHNCTYENGSINYAGMDANPTGTNGNISVDPKIADVNLFSGAGNHHLVPGSPCIGAGDVSAVHAGDLDLDGDTRSEGGTVDIGADQFVIHPFTIQSESVPSAEVITLTLIGQPGVAYTWERSTNLREVVIHRAVSR